MRLSELLYDIADMGVTRDCEIEKITTRAAEAASKTLCFCIKGRKEDGHRYAAKAAQRGAVIICERECGVSGAIRVPDVRACYARVCARWYGDPAKEMVLCAVTGTNGKTSVATVIYRLLSRCGKKAGMIGTTGAEWQNHAESLSLTTPDPKELHRILRKMADAGITHVVMEASSHALDQKRLAGIRFFAGIFTNLTQDHFDYHENMVEYFCAKKTLFAQCERAVVCIDDSYGKELAAALDIPVQTVSRSGDAAHYEIRNMQSDALGVTFRLSCFGMNESVRFGVPGDFSAENAVCAVACCAMLGIGIESLLPKLARVGTIPGRCEVIENRLGITVVCDYAHTPDGLEKLLCAVRGFTKKQLIVVFGCGGDRDRKKRPLMGAAAARYADFIVLTSDNPRSERPGAILSDIRKGFPPFVSYIALTSRAAAIRYAIDRAKPGDTVVFAGKGHESGQNIAGKQFAFDERRMIRRIITLTEEKTLS